MVDSAVESAAILVHKLTVLGKLKLVVAQAEQH